MSTTNAPAGASAQGLAQSGEPQRAQAFRSYFLSDPTRIAQSILGLIWLLDGGLQFQSFMYSKGFIESITALAPGSEQRIKRRHPQAHEVRRRREM